MKKRFGIIILLIISLITLSCSNVLSKKDVKKFQKLISNFTDFTTQISYIYEPSEGEYRNENRIYAFLEDGVYYLDYNATYSMNLTDKNIYKEENGVKELLHENVTVTNLDDFVKVCLPNDNEKMLLSINQYLPLIKEIFNSDLNYKRLNRGNRIRIVSNIDRSFISENNIISNELIKLYGQVKYDELMSSALNVNIGISVSKDFKILYPDLSILFDESHIISFY